MFEPSTIFHISGLSRKIVIIEKVKKVVPLVI